MPTDTTITNTNQFFEQKINRTEVTPISKKREFAIVVEVLE
jgi:hypothetical protein